ncbi:MAG TPA: hypothetical protein VN598_12430 [Usitatibacter sp.]|nr:hypothetical protein [Usitatibacter sp.]
MRRETRGARAAFVAAALLLAACHEIPQDAAKPYAGKEDTKAYAGDRFNGDKAKYEKALADRAQNENEYLRTHDAKNQ